MKQIQSAPELEEPDANAFVGRGASSFQYQRHIVEANLFHVLLVCMKLGVASLVKSPSRYVKMHVWKIDRFRIKQIQLLFKKNLKRKQLEENKTIGRHFWGKICFAIFYMNTEFFVIYFIMS